MPSRHVVAPICLVLLFAFGPPFACHRAPEATSDPNAHANTVEWIAFDVNTVDSQADANLLRFPNGANYLIDAGDANGKLVDHLKTQGVAVIDKIYISHAHKDHYGGLLPILKSSIQMKQVFFNVPDQSVTKRDGGLDLKDVNDTLTALRQRGVEIKSVWAGDTAFSEGGIRLEVLYAFDGVQTPVGPTDVNDMSVIMLLSNADMKALFTGDLNFRLGTYLAESGDARLHAQFLKFPHHGAENLAPNSFFDLVNPSVVVVPAPEQLWLSERSRRAREWAAAKMVGTYVTGSAGNVQVSLRPDRYDITTPKTTH
jgi:beta-lactamase superfamily II metal-dependent hydrolase